MSEIGVPTGSCCAEDVSLEPRREKTRYKLSRVNETPAWQRRPYILNGYRVHFSYTLCVQSLIRLHNETGNVWTHLLGFFLFAYRLIRCSLNYPSTEGPDGYDASMDSFWCITYFIGACSCMLSSSLFHLFNCHSLPTMACMFRCDINGINLIFIASFLPGIYYGFQCHPWWRSFYMCLVSLILAAASVISNVDRFRRLKSFDCIYKFMMAGIAAFALIPSLHWFCISTQEEIDLFAVEVFKLLGLYGVGFVFFVTRFPESYFPGKFDLFCTSHQIWHVFVFLAALSWAHTLTKVIGFRREFTCSAGLQKLEASSETSFS